MAVAHQGILKIDLNPVLAYPHGIMVVDARIIVQQGTTWLRAVIAGDQG
jgi:hypothetical protein